MIEVSLCQLVAEQRAVNAALLEVDAATDELVRHIDGAPAKRAAARYRLRRAQQQLDLAETRLHFRKSRLAGVPHLHVL